MRKQFREEKDWFEKEYDKRKLTKWQRKMRKTQAFKSRQDAYDFGFKHAKNAVKEVLRGKFGKPTKELIDELVGEDVGVALDRVSGMWGSKHDTAITAATIAAKREGYKKLSRLGTRRRVRGRRKR
jgi:hypothetical protein